MAPSSEKNCNFKNPNSFKRRFADSTQFSDTVFFVILVDIKAFLINNL